MFKVGKFYVHEKAMDCCIEIRNALSHSCMVQWWNLGFTGHPWKVGRTQVIALRQLDISQWREIDPTKERVCV